MNQPRRTLMVALVAATVGAALWAAPASGAPTPGADLLAPITPDLPIAGAGQPPAPVATPGAGAQAVTPARAGTDLVGTFKITAGKCGGGGVTSGSYFRMVNPGGTPGAGPYTGNSSTTCGDSSWTPLAPGSDGGLLTSAYQPHPDPAFTGVGDAAAERIITPVSFNGVDFSAATNATDPQTDTLVAVPSISAAGGKLTGDLRAWAAAWNRQHFNQGAPKPDGSSPGQTKALTGTYNSATGAYTLEWSSQIQGGPFNNFTGVWHLEGTFASSAGSSDDTNTTAPGASGDDTGAGNQVAAGTASTGGSGRLPATGGAAGLVGLVAYGLSMVGAALRRRGFVA